MARIEAEMAQMGALAVGPGHYALGRGHLVLHEPTKALVHLRTAWEADYRKPEVEYALGQALGELYKEELEQAQRISDKNTRQARQRALEEELLKPALEHLGHVGQGEHVESPAYVEGLIAFYSKQYDEALRKASEAAEQSLWRHEASKLEADVHTALGNEKRDQGQHEAALDEYTRAAAAYRTAREAARSDATIHDAECQMWVQMIELQAGRGTNPKPSLDKAVSACDDALLADPDSASAYGHKSWAYARWGTHLAKTMQPSRQAFETSIELGKSALRLHPDDPSTLDTLGTSYMAIANHQLQHGEDPLDALRQSAASFEHALKIHPTFAWAWNDLGVAFCAMGDYEAGHGIDPRASYDRCIDSVKSSIAQDPSYHVPATNEALANAMKALYELRSGIDPRPSAEKAEAACRRSLAINPSYQHTHEVLGMTHLVRAEHDLYRDLDPTPSVKKAIEAFSASLSIHPSAFYSHMGIVLSYRLQAMDLLRKGADPTEALRQANVAQAKMAELNPDEAETHLRSAQIAVLSARWAVRRRDSRAAQLMEQGEQAIERAIRSNPMSFEVFEAAADLHRFKAIWQLRRKKSPLEEIDRGLAAAERGLMIHPTATALLEVKGALQLLQVRAGGDSGTKSDVARQARALLDETFRKNPLLQWVHSATWSELDAP
jgi:serine/threonine-protein kinase